MDSISRLWYETRFENEFLKKSGMSFQDFFCEIMEKCHPGDFQRVRPWGNIGDRKNDGYLRSMRMLFQVYAPNEMRQSEALAKIDDDFNGALPYWKDYFDFWVFTHNSRMGLSPDILKKLLDLEREHFPLRLPSWGYEELKNKFFDLNDIDIAAFLGFAPSMQDMLDTGFGELKIVLETISEKEPLLDQNLSPVSREKLSSNALSHNVVELIKYGQIKAHHVDRFFNEYHDPEYGDKIARVFNEKYVKLKNQNLSPDNIFAGLQEFAGGAMRKSPKIEAAVLSVLTYLFERCDIFEQPRSEG